MGARLGLAAACVVLVIGCAHRPAAFEFDTSGAGRSTVDGLYAARGRMLARTFVKPGARFGDFEGVVLEATTLRYAIPSAESNRFDRIHQGYELGPEWTARMKQIVHDSLGRGVVESGSYSLEPEAGERVLRIAPHLVELFFSAPPRYANEQEFLLRTGEMTLVVEIFDSQSGERLALLVDRRVIRPVGSSYQGFESTSVTAWAGVRDVCQVWSNGLAETLRRFHAASPIPDAPASSAEGT